jgi:hypothetical protein
MSKYEQLKRYAVCQHCGRTLEREAAREQGWLIAPYRGDPAIDVVRCWRHISVRALRNSYAGRTHYWLSRMWEGRAMAAMERQLSPRQILAEPFPTRDEIPGGLNDGSRPDL